MKERAKNGDVIKVQRYCGIYAHYGVYVEQGPCVTVIHYVEASGQGDSRGVVRETTLKKFLNGAEDYAVCHFSGPTFSGEETIRRARSKLGEGGYSVVWHNCEHFAAWCKTGEEKSSQVRGWATALGLACLALLAPGAPRASARMMRQTTRRRRRARHRKTGSQRMGARVAGPPFCGARVSLGLIQWRR